MARIIGIVLVVLVALMVVAIVTPNVHPHPQSARQTRAVANLKTLVMAQIMFRKDDRYGTDALVYANPKNGRGAADLYTLPDGTELKLIDWRLAEAFREGTSFDGYVYRDVPCGDYTINFAACAVPEAYDETGHKVFYVDESGMVYETDPGEINPSQRKGAPVPPVPNRLTEKDLTETWRPVY